MAAATTADLTSVLAERGVIAAAANRILARFGDDGVDEAFRIIERFDEKGGGGVGLLVRMLEHDVPPPERLDSVERRHRQFDQARAWARANGFTDRQAPFAAMAQLTINALGGQPATAAQVRERVRAQYSWLFDDEKTL